VDALAGIDLVVFDKDGTLIDFQAMWGDWVRELVAGLTGATAGRVGADAFDFMGFDPDTGRVEAHGLLAATPMARTREALEAYLAERLGSAAQAAAVMAAVWHPPDPVALAHPIGDLRALFEELRRRGARIAVATSDDRTPTERTLAALGIAELVESLVCADDGFPVKPAPDPVLRICRALEVVPGRTAVVGDAVADLAMGRAAGAGRVIGVLTGAGDRSTLTPLADLVLESIQELLPAG
jgi:phosphoglycolate phosphatase